MNLNILDLKIIKKSGIKKINNDIKFPYNSGVKTIDLPDIEECKDIFGDYSSHINMNNLNSCGYMRVNVGTLDLPKLEYAEGLDFSYTRIVYLPKLKKVNGGLYFNSATDIYLYSLEEATALVCINAKQLVIPKKFASEIKKDPYHFKINRECEIVYTEDKLKESFSFKSYFMR